MKGRQCRTCGAQFEPDSCMRFLCESCRDDGYRKKPASEPMHYVRNSHLPALGFAMKASS